MEFETNTNDSEKDFLPFSPVSKGFAKLQRPSVQRPNTGWGYENLQ